MLHYLQNLFQAMDFSSLTDAVLRVAAVFLCLTVHETCHGLAALALGDNRYTSGHSVLLHLFAGIREPAAFGMDHSTYEKAGSCGERVGKGRGIR